MPWSKKRNSWQQDIRGIDYMGAILKALLMDIIIGYLFYHTLWASVFFLPVLIPYIHFWEEKQEQQLREVFQVQFKDYLQALATAISVGYALENAMKEARRDLEQQYEGATRIMRDTRMLGHLLDLNMPVEQVWQEWEGQAQVEVLSRFATVFVVAKRSGGDSIGIIKHAIHNICDTMEVEEEIKVVLSGQRMEFQVMSLVPLGILCYMKFSFAEFMSALYGNAFGVILMTICLGVYGGAVLWGNRIIQIEV